jgi:hypothetical protein
MDSLSEVLFDVAPTVAEECRNQRGGLMHTPVTGAEEPALDRLCMPAPPSKGHTLDNDQASLHGGVFAEASVRSQNRRSGGAECRSRG